LRIACTLRLLFVVSILSLVLTSRGQCPGRDKLLQRIILPAEYDSSFLKTQLKDLLQYGAAYKTCNYGDSIYILLLRAIGRNYAKLSSYATAIEYYRKSIDVITSSGKQSPFYIQQHLSGYFWISEFYANIKNTSGKMRAIDSCITLAIRLNATSNLSFIKCLYLRAAYFFDKGDYHRCIKDAELCEKFAAEFVKSNAHELEKQHAESHAFSSSGWYVNAQLALNNYQAVEKYLAQRIIRYKQLNLPDYLGVTYGQLAEMHWRNGNNDKVLHYYETSLKYFHQTKDWLRYKQIMKSMGCDVYYKRLHNYGRALEYYRKALSYSSDDDEAEEDEMEVLNIYANIANVYVRQKKFDSAFMYFQRAFDQVKTGVDETYILYASPEEKKGFKKVHYFASLVMDKGDALLEKFKTNHDLRDLNEAVCVYKVADQLLNSIKAEQSAIESKLFWRYDTRRLYEHAIEACRLQNNMAGAFYFFEKSRAVLLNDQLTAQHWLGAEDSIPLNRVQHKLLKDHGALLEIFAGDSAVYSLMVTRSAVNLEKFSKRDWDSLTTLFSQYNADAARINKDFEGYRKVSHALYNLILKAKPPPAGRIIISPDGGYFPFEALIVDNSGEKPLYFMQDHAVSYTYSARYLYNSIKPDRQAQKELLGVAPVNYAPDLKLNPLYGSDASLRTINGFFKKSHNMLGLEASRNKFLDDFSDYKVVQLYTHASDSSTDTSGHNEPVIYFADAPLYLSDLIPREKPATRLIVLSACETARGKVYQGEGVFNFNRGFAALGIPSSVTNLWEVQNESTYRLTELFYKYMSEGEPLDVALQKAKLDFFERAWEDKTLASVPSYWAAAIMMGNTEPIDEKKSMTWIWIAGAAAIILTSLVIYIRRKNR
jgi:CHAT domain-containing protein